MAKSPSFRVRLARKIADEQQRAQHMASFRDVLQVDSIAKTLQLCYLQISQAIPIAINLAVYALSKNNIDVYIRSVNDIELGYHAYHLRLLSYATDSLAHCFHFYAYLAFSKIFRDAFMKKFFSK